jgi:membrane protein DedA with SNARE-associated domain
LAGALKMDFKKFLIIDFLMIIYWISYLFLVWMVWFHIALHFLWEKVWYLFPLLILIYLIWEYLKNKKKL